jgi:hypothetical protein
MSRTIREQYTGSKTFDRTCRNHGSCDYCKDNRTFFDRRRRPLVPSKEDAVDEYVKWIIDESEADTRVHYCSIVDDWQCSEICFDV